MIVSLDELSEVSGDGVGRRLYGAVTSLTDEPLARTHRNL